MLAGLRRDDFHPAVMRLDDFLADGQAQAQPDVARGEEWQRRLTCGLGGEACAVVLHLNLHVLPAFAVGRGLQAHVNGRRPGIGLERVEHDFGERVLERGAVAGDGDGFAGVLAFHLRSVGGLVFARLLIGVLDQFFDGEHLVLQPPLVREKPHLVDQARDALDAIGHRAVEGFAELAFPEFLAEQLLVRGERHHGVADFVREAVGHGLDEAQIGGLDFQTAQLLGLREVFGREQRGNGHGGIAALKRHDADVVNRARRIFRFVTERPDGRAGFQDLINFRAERLRQIAEFQFAGALVFVAEMAARGLVGVKHLQVAPDDDAGAAQFAQHVGHHLVVAGELVVQPDVAEGEADLFEQMENEFQLDVDERFAGDAPVENGDAGNRFAVGNRHGDLRAEQFKFLLRLDVGARLVAVAAENPCPSRASWPPMPASSDSSKCSSRPEERPMAATAWSRRLSLR